MIPRKTDCVCRTLLMFLWPWCIYIYIYIYIYLVGICGIKWTIIVIKIKYIHSWSHKMVFEKNVTILVTQPYNVYLRQKKICFGLIYFQCAEICNRIGWMQSLRVHWSYYILSFDIKIYSFSVINIKGNIWPLRLDNVRSLAFEIHGDSEYWIFPWLAHKKLKLHIAT